MKQKQVYVFQDIWSPSIGLDFEREENGVIVGSGGGHYSAVIHGIARLIRQGYEVIIGKDSDGLTLPIRNLEAVAALESIGLK